ncbi:MAG: trigger factor [Elusimicrobiaceae bacterium]|nr:trigger factor [Elusimicrobiaceae bacterium]
MTATKTQTVKVKRLKEEGCTIELAITAAEELTSESFQDALVRVQAKARVPGFRQGKAPLAMLKQHYSGAIKEQALDIAVRKSVDLALESEKLNPVVTPVIRKLDFDEHKPLSMELEVEVSPTVEPKKYTGAKVKRTAPKVDDSAADAEISQMLEYNSHLEAVDGEEAGGSHFVIVSYAGTKDGAPVKGFSSDGEMIDMSAPQTIAGMAEAVAGAKKGDVREFETEVAGTGKVKVSVTVTEIKKKVLPELNDEFARKMGFDTVAALRERIVESLKKDAEAKSESDVVRQIEDHLLNENEFAIPKSLLEHHVESSLKRFSAQMFGNADYKMPDAQKKNLSEKIRPNSERDIKVGYLIHAIARKENLVAAEADFEAELNRNLELARNDDEKKKTREFFSARRPDVLITLTERKVIEYLKQNAKITEAK